MCLLLETIKCLDGKPENLDFHQARFEHTQKSLFGLMKHELLEKVITVPGFAQKGLFRCRVLYAAQIEKIEFLPYNFRNVKTLRLVENNETSYSFKYADRAGLEKLFAMKGNCDDIIIVKNGLITDSFAANLIFFDGEKWWTPDSPLLNGIQRTKLLYEKKIQECKITPEHLSQYSKAGLINAMIDMENMPVIEMGNIQG